MKQASFRFYEELNDFLPRNQRKTSFNYSFSGRHTVKEVIEELGVPHPEVDLVIVNGKSVDFNYRLQNNDRVAVYPMFEAIDISPIAHLRPKPLRDIKFILDLHLGRLAKYLRICGFDSVYENLDDNEIIARAKKEQRIILTKDKGLLKNKEVTHGYWVRDINPRKQLLEIISRFDLIGKIQFLVRCLLCNALLQTISKEEVMDLISQNTSEFYEEFFLCPHCNKIYWKGSHYKNMNELINFVETTLKHK